MDVVLDRTHSEPLDSSDVQARPPRLAWPLLYNPKNNISEDFREDAVDAWRGWRAPRRGTVKRGCTRASITFSTTHTTPSNDRSALPVRLRALSVPSDRNRSPRGRLRAATMVGAARARQWRRSGGRMRSIRAPETGRSDRRARIREAHGHIIYILGRGRARGGHGWGGNGSTCGVSSGFRAPRAKM